MTLVAQRSPHALAVRHGEHARDKDDREREKHSSSFPLRTAAADRVRRARGLKGGMTAGDVRSHSFFGQDGQTARRRYTRIARHCSAHTPASMTAKTNDPGLTTESERAAAAYGAHYDLLRFIATQRFRVPQDDVRGIVHDVFIAFLRNEAKIARTERDERSWLVGTTCNTCRYYWRKRGDGTDAPPTLNDPIDPVAVADEAERRLLLAGVLRRLPERCRELLVRRYGEGYTPEEIATWQSIKHGSAKNLISKCLLAARAAFHRLLRRRS